MSTNDKAKKAKAPTAGGDNKGGGAAEKKTEEKKDGEKGGGGKKGKGGKGAGAGLDDAAGSKARNVSVLDEAAMENAYNICHNVQDLLYFRGFFWEGDSKKGKGKGRKKKGKSK